MVKAFVPLRLVFFGSPDFAVPSLEALERSRHSVVGVVTQPDRARGRGHQTQPGPVKRLALRLGLPILQPDRLNNTDFLASLSSLEADLGVVVAYGKLLTEAVLHMPRLGLINVHASLLPQYRGAAPIHRAVMAGAVETGVTIMRVVKALDAGPTLATASRAIGPDETSDEVERDLAVLGAAMLVDTIEAIVVGSAVETPQDDSQATYARKIDRGDGGVNWSRSASEIHNQIRGLHPWPHAFSYLSGERIILLKSQAEHDAPANEAPPGTILVAHGDALRVQTGEGVLQLLVVQREGRRPMSARKFLAGRHVGPGDVFQTTSGSP